MFKKPSGHNRPCRKPGFKGTLIRVALILDKLPDSLDHANIVAEFPHLQEAHKAAARNLPTPSYGFGAVP